MSTEVLGKPEEEESWDVQATHHSWKFATEIEWILVCVSGTPGGEQAFLLESGRLVIRI